MIIRPEEAHDLDAISAVTQAAFRDVAYSDHTEHLVIQRLRRAGALAVSLVAEEEGAIIGHIGFSPVGLPESSATWFGLGPLCVLPERQGQGFGLVLVQHGSMRFGDAKPVAASSWEIPPTIVAFVFVTMRG